MTCMLKMGSKYRYINQGHVAIMTINSEQYVNHNSIMTFRSNTTKAEPFYSLYKENKNGSHAKIRAFLNPLMPGGNRKVTHT